MVKEIDLHSMSVIESKKYLKTYLNTLGKGVVEVRVIHGYSSGTNLQKFVRKEFNHKRIERKILELNPGMTTFIIKN